MKKTISVALCLIMIFSTAAIGGDGFCGLFDTMYINASATDEHSYSVGDVVEFGLYPQSRVTDNKLINELNGRTLTWKSYGYYSNNEPSDYMRYADVTYKGCKYRAVTFDLYRPNSTTESASSTPSTYYNNQYINGYTISQIYWFKYDPIHWRILDPDTGLMICEDVIDSQAYCDCVFNDDDKYIINSSGEYASDWNTSSIKEWLNGTFCNLAFNSSEKSNLKMMNYSADYNDGSTHLFSGKVRLLNQKESEKTEYGFSPDEGYYSDPDWKPNKSRMALGTEYAKCQGVACETNENADMFKNAIWMLSTRCDTILIESINTYGRYPSRAQDVVYHTYGVRPVICINLSAVSMKIITPDGDYYFKKDLDYYANNTSSTSYNPELSYMLMALADCAYNHDLDDIRESAQNLGFDKDSMYLSEIYNLSADEELLSAFFIAKKRINNQDIVLISVRGTGNALHLDPSEWAEGKLPIMGEWFSDIFGTGQGVPFFGTGTNWHQGYKNVADLIWKCLDEEIYKDADIPKTNVKYFVTGHSRGAGIANLLSIKLDQHGVSKDNVYDYNFACPDSASDYISSWNTFGNHDNMFNVCDCQDIVTYLPGILMKNGMNLPTVSWGKYGITKFFSFDWDDPGYTVIDINMTSAYTAHSPKVYLTYLRELHGWDEFKDYNAVKASRAGAYLSLLSEGIGNIFDALDCISISKIRCPVDAVVKDDSGKKLASVIANKPHHYADNIWAIVDGDKKAIIVFDNKHVNIELNATDKGEMNFDVSQYSFIEDKELDEKSFSNVKLASGKTMLSDIGNTTEVKDVTLSVIGKNGSVIAIVNEDGSEEWTDTSLSDVRIRIGKAKTVDERTCLGLCYDVENLPESGNYGVKYEVFQNGKCIESNIENEPNKLLINGVFQGYIYLYDVSVSTITYKAGLCDASGNYIVNGNGEEVSKTSENITVKKVGFFKRIILFFRALFVNLPFIIIEAK